MPSRSQHILAVLTICHLAGCKGESPEAQVRKAFEGAVKAVEAGDAAGVSDLLARDFQGPEGLDRGGARLYLLGVFRQGKVGVTVLGNRVEARGPEAFQSVELVLTSKGSGLLPQDASRRAFRLRWIEEGGRWRLLRVEEGGA